jgi:hypothetical protein
VKKIEGLSIPGLEDDGADRKKICKKFFKKKKCLRGGTEHNFYDQDQ